MPRISTLIVAIFAGLSLLVPASPADSAPSSTDSFGLVDPASGVWHLYEDGRQTTQFLFGNPGDVPFAGDWNCSGVDTPGLYRQSDGFVYLRNSNTQGVADVSFFFGDPGDVPLAGDFDGDGCDTVSIYRPSNQTFYVINDLGVKGGLLGVADYSFVFGNPGDTPFVGDFNGDGRDTPGLHRASTGLVYYRDSNTTGVADNSFIFGDPGDRFVAGDWTGNGVDSPGVFRPSNTTMYLRYQNSQGNADETHRVGTTNWMPVSGDFGIAAPPPPGGGGGGDLWVPSPGTTWHWQLTGGVDVSVDADVFDVDLVDTSAATVAELHARGRAVVCYMSAGSWEEWRPDAGVFPDSVLGRSNGWPGEKWLDIRRIDVLGPIMEARLDLCAAKGFDGVEFDNVDGYSNNTGFDVSAADQTAYNLFLAEAAHVRGLSAGYKNNVDQAAAQEPFFEFSVNEECFVWDECEALTPFIDAGKAVFHVEYEGSTSQFCPATSALGFSSMKKRLNLGVWADTCW